jgi:hypothetical protein
MKDAQNQYTKKNLDTASTKVNPGRHFGVASKVVAQANTTHDEIQESKSK